ncbi:phosphotransferase family enzyme [Maribacter vaceletii]|uniref:Phosphotransferase family enzyme n=1 Tax=Maribacter vaceletii TaxID=1206816 RepID=A0A495EBK8_9FLAO|nr:aminoglycoside phosphotransferase family protein [Maribacter vaceletii]RKR14240.1 phosphotransferase family enzyme [Maribacter vaceletii]
MQTYSNTVLQNIISNFIDNAQKYYFTPITNGLINTTFLVSDTNNYPTYILQRVNSDVFLDTAALMQNINNAIGVLQHNTYAKIEFLKSKENKKYVSTTHGDWRVLTYINNTVVYNTTTNTKVAFEAGKIIGTFHSLLEKEDTTKYKDSIPDFHNLEIRKKQFLKALETTSVEQKTTAKKAITFTNTLFPILSPLQDLKIPARVCHNDTKLNNILFSKTNTKALCLIDLDTIMKGYFFYDFGDAVRTIVNTAPEDEKELSKITFNKELFIAFVNGLKTNSNFLTHEEIKTLPLGVVFMPFIHGLRALTDYLNGNKYYKVSYKNQNLDRAISLFSFAQKAAKELDFMTNLIYYGNPST